MGSLGEVERTYNLISFPMFQKKDIVTLKKQ